MRKLACILVAIVMIAAMVAGFGCEEEERAHIVLGGTLPLSGVYAETGLWIEKGYRCWAEDINAKGGLLGRQVDLIIYDDTSNTEKAVTLLEKAITVDKVDLLLGGYPGTSCDAQMPIAEKYKMIYVSMGGHMPSFERGYKYSFSATPLMGQWWCEGFGAFLQTLPQAERPTSAAMITMNNVIGQAVRESTVEWMAKLNIPIVVDEYYDLPLASAESLVSKCKQSGADLMFANGMFADGVLTIRAMRSLDYNPKAIFQGVGSLVPAWEEELGVDANYVFSGTALHHSLPYPEIQELNRVCQDKYSQPYAPDYFLFGYSWMETLQRGVEGAGSLNQDAIEQYLRTHEITVLGKKYTFDEKGLPPPYNYCTQVLNGTVELVWPRDVASAQPAYPKPTWEEMG
jgi:branched-chain amino acid transport system substrate-binding protein